MWDVKTGAPYGSPLTADTSPVSDVAFSPDGRTLVSSHLRSAVVWSMSGEQAIGEPLGGPAELITDVAFSPDGKRLAAGRFGGGTIVYDPATRRQASRIDGDSVVTAVAFHPDGKLIAVGTIDGNVRFFDPKSGAAVGSPARRGERAGLAGGLQPGRSGCSRWPWTRTASERRSTPSSGRARCSSGTWSPGAAWAGRSRRAADRCSPWRSTGDGTLLATGSRGRLDLWDVATRARHGKPMKVADDGS